MNSIYRAMESLALKAEASVTAPARIEAYRLNGASAVRDTLSVMPLDYDRDGLMDLFIGSHAAREDSLRRNISSHSVRREARRCFSATLAKGALKT